MAGNILSIGKRELKDIYNKTIHMGDEVVLLPVGGWRMRKGIIVRQTEKSVFLEDGHYTSKEKCDRHCMKL